MAFSGKREKKRVSERETEKEEAVEETNRHVGEHRAIKRGVPKKNMKNHVRGVRVWRDVFERCGDSRRSLILCRYLG